MQDSEEHTIIGYVSPIGILNPESRLKFNTLSGHGANTGNGNYTYSHTDLRMPGIGLDFIFQRTYNSLNCGVDGPLGYGWTHNFDARLIDDGKRVFVFWPDGHADYYIRNHDNMTEENPAKANNLGCYDTLYYSDSDKTYTITQKDQTLYKFKVSELSSDPNNALTPFDVAQLITIVERNENSISLAYDQKTGNLLRIVDTVGRVIEFSYFATLAEGSSSHIRAISDPVGRQIIFSYDSAGNLESVGDPMGNTTLFAYDANRQMQSLTLPEGQKLENQYDDFRVSKQTIDQKSYDFDYVSETEVRIASPTSSSGNRDVTVHTISDGQLSKILDPLQYGVDFKYTDPTNPTKPKEIVDKNGNVTIFSYDDGTNDTGKKVLQRGNVLSVSNALNQKTEFSYDDKNNLLQKTDPLGFVTTYGYDEAKRNLVKITYPEGGIQLFAYTAKGQIENSTDPNGHITRYQYDGNGNLIQTTDPLNNHVDFIYDAVGRKLSKKDELGRITAYTQDANDNLVRTVQNVSEKSYTTDYLYDKNNNLIIVRDPRGKETKYTYNARNLLATETDPLHRAFRYEYDERGNIAKIIDPDAKETSYRYDSNNRLTSTLYEGLTAVSFNEYDRNGNIIKMNDIIGETQLTYDVLNRVSSYRSPLGGMVSYEYDAAGNRTKIVYPGGKEVSYHFDGNNRLDRVTDWLNGITTYIYDDAGLLREAVKPDGTKSLYTFDAANRLIGLSNKKSDDSIICSYSYTLDPFGNQTEASRNEPLNPTRKLMDVAYGYDDANQLSWATGGNFLHDNRGNLRMTSNGNMYEYDFADRLSNVTTANKTVRSVYDGFGNRIKRIEGGKDVNYLLDLNGPMSQVLTEFDSAGNPTSYYIYGDGLISRITNDEKRYCYHYDSRGSTIAITDESENISHKYSYDEFGEVLAAEEEFPNPFRYVGKYGVMDEGDGLYFMRARYYDASSGRFMSKDPLGFGGGDLNLYAYVGGNPVMGIDPKGTRNSWIETVDRIVNFVDKSVTLINKLDKYYDIQRSVDGLNFLTAPRRNILISANAKMGPLSGVATGLFVAKSSYCLVDNVVASSYNLLTDNNVTACNPNWALKSAPIISDAIDFYQMEKSALEAGKFFYEMAKY